MARFGDNVHKLDLIKAFAANNSKCECGSSLNLWGCRNKNCENYWKNNVVEDKREVVPA